MADFVVEPPYFFSLNPLYICISVLLCCSDVIIDPHHDSCTYIVEKRRASGERSEEKRREKRTKRLCVYGREKYVRSVYIDVYHERLDGGHFSFTFHTQPFQSQLDSVP